MLNSFELRSYEDFESIEKEIITIGKKKLNYFELCPCIVEVNRKNLRNIVSEYIKNNGGYISYEDVKKELRSILFHRKEKIRILNAEYFEKDYIHDLKAFNEYKTNESCRTRRQFLYFLFEKSCMNSFQIFEDNKTIILNFRSCDYIKKFLFDVVLIESLLEEFDIKIEKIICFIGSLHIYEGD